MGKKHASQYANFGSLLFYLQKRILFNKLFVSGFLMQKPLNATITIKLANKIIYPIADNTNGAINNFSIHNEKS